MGLSATALFALLPYLALYLKQQFALSNSAAGLVVGSIALVSSGGAWAGGMLADRLGWLPMLRLAAALYVLVFAALFAARSAEAAIGLILLIGLCRLLMEPALKSALVQYDDGSGRLFKLRYMSLVGGAMLGPLLATAMAPYGPQSCFSLAAAVFALFLATSTRLRAGPAPARAGAAPLAVDRWAMAGLIALGFVFFLVFSQYESTLSLRLDMAFAPEGGPLYRRALFVNAALAIPAMYLSDRTIAKLPMHLQVAIGVAALTAALWLLFGAAPAQWCVDLGAVLFTLGEVILFPLPDIAAARLATNENRGRLMGLVDLRYLGFFAGPAMGGALLDHSATLLASVLCLLALAIFPIYLLNERRLQAQAPPSSCPPHHDRP
ncbi:MAG TPA: MFS transporter [Ideonella sp.]|uniref:MFS transporter n=1 Tax=Ideonella sp. TaxID=1929293 RepID=UPI002D05FB21|nr:MFS transporter [Ideonella sp.]HSI48648.1 MFS transporter [Ideonella sp.]